MDPVLDSEWLGSKNDSIEEAQSVGNIVRSWQWRERGIDPLNSPSNKNVLENVAEDILVQKPLKIRVSFSLKFYFYINKNELLIA